jgi:serine protease Do
MGRHEKRVQFNWKEVNFLPMKTVHCNGYLLLRTALLLSLLCLAVIAVPARGADLERTIEQVKPSIVAVGTFLKTRSPAVQFVGTGFAVADGRFIVTNAHVANKPLDTQKLETPVVLVSKNGEPAAREAELLAIDKEHDLALMKISGDPLAALKLGDSATVSEGRVLAFTGFPIGMVLGFHPATHRGMVSAITPIVTPGITAKQLNAQMISRIRESTYNVFQLDGTAYPGNSGSPLYDPENGAVYGIINSVFVRGTRESAISQPSGITYAIPSRYIRALLSREKVPGFE